MISFYITKSLFFVILFLGILKHSLSSIPINALLISTSIVVFNTPFCISLVYDQVLVLLWIMQSLLCAKGKFILQLKQKH